MVKDVHYLICMIISMIVALVAYHVGHDTESIIFFGFYYTCWILLKVNDAREDIKDAIRKGKYAD
jgi:hypothetical protein